MRAIRRVLELSTLSLVSLCLVALVLPQAARAADGAATAFEFPASDPGRHAQAWFAAYHEGEPALRAFWTAHGAAASLAQRPVEPRLAFLRQVRADQGELTPVRVLASTPDACEVLARAEHGGTLRIRFECEPGAPHGLAGIRIQPEDDGTGPGGAPGGERRVIGGPPAGGAPPPEAEPAGPPPTDAQVVAALAAQLDSLAHLGVFSGAVQLDKGGRTLFARAVGMAARTPHRANTLETRFNLGSLNKIFTHVAIEQLAQARRLSLDDPVTRWLPGYKVANANRITLRMLLDHRGGVPDMFANPGYDQAAGHLRTLADWYALVQAMPLRFEPGTRQEYSNGGFVLLGMVVAAASGEDYYDYVRKHVYAPAGMTRTAHLAPAALGADVAVGYTRNTGTSADPEDNGLPPGLVPNTATLPALGSSAGGGYSTVGDLVRFADALRAGRLIDAAHVRDVFGEHFALGIAGGSPGVNGLFVVTGPYTLAVLANLDPPAAEQFGPTVGRMMRRAAGLPAPTRTPMRAQGGH